MRDINITILTIKGYVENSVIRSLLAVEAGINRLTFDDLFQFVIQDFHPKSPSRKTVRSACRRLIAKRYIRKLNNDRFTLNPSLWNDCKCVCLVCGEIQSANCHLRDESRLVMDKVPKHCPKHWFVEDPYRFAVKPKLNSIPPTPIVEKILRTRMLNDMFVVDMNRLLNECRKGTVQ